MIDRGGPGGAHALRTARPDDDRRHLARDGEVRGPGPGQEYRTIKLQQVTDPESPGHLQSQACGQPGQIRFIINSKKT